MTKIRVLVVDDSVFFRKQLTAILAETQSIEVIATAKDGIEGVEMALRLQPDLIIMDIEMPKLDGIEASRLIRQQGNIPILLFSGITKQGASMTLEALEVGASDFMFKDFTDIHHNRVQLQQSLKDKIHALVKAGTSVNRAMDKAQANGASQLAESITPNSDLIIICASTGGPQVIQQLLTKLPKSFSVPILVLQHMPNLFTKTFADRLDSLCQIEVKEAQSGDCLSSGRAYIAPGGMQTQISSIRPLSLKIIQSSQERIYAPSIDLTLHSLAQQCDKMAGVIMVLTGMGKDGLLGIRALKEKGADFQIWAQAKHECVVYGMPKAIDEAMLSHKQLTTAELISQMQQLDKNHVTVC